MKLNEIKLITLKRKSKRIGRGTGSERVKHVEEVKGQNQEAE